MASDKKTKYLFLDTNDVVNTTHNNCQFVLKGSDASYSKISLKKFVTLNSQYTIDSRNNRLVFIEDGVGSPVLITITSGNYDVNTLITEVETKMTSTGLNTYTMTYNTSTMKYSFATSGSSVQFLPTSTCLYELGFTEGVATVAADPLVSDKIVRLDGAQYIDIITNIPVFTSTSNEKTNVLQRIPVNVPSGSLIVYESRELVYHQLTDNLLTNLELRVCDDRGRLWQGNGQNIVYAFVMSQ